MTKNNKDLIQLGDTLSVSPNIATSKTAAFGSNGSGKTYMVGKLNEELLTRGGWVIIFDPVGIHWGLRLDESGDIQHQVLSILDGPGKRILRPSLQVYPQSMHKDDLAVAAGYKPGVGGFTGPLSRLSTMGIIDYPESGRAIAESFLFLS